MLLTADRRVFSLPEERFQRCARCGKDLVVLPNDRRGGYCFECLVLSPPLPRGCPSCQYLLDGSETPPGECPRCGWIDRH